MTLLDHLRLHEAKSLYLDANCFIYAVEGFPVIDVELRAVFDAIDSGKFQAVTSELTLAECLAKPTADGDNDLQDIYNSMLTSEGGLTMIPVTREILIQSASVRALNRTLRLPDAIHIATAQHHTCDTFITNDARIKSIPGTTVVILKELLNI